MYIGVIYTYVYLLIHLFISPQQDWAYSTDLLEKGSVILSVPGLIGTRNRVGLRVIGLGFRVIGFRVIG